MATGESQIESVERKIDTENLQGYLKYKLVDCEGMLQAVLKCGGGKDVVTEMELEVKAVKDEIRRLENKYGLVSDPVQDNKSGDADHCDEGKLQDSPVTELESDR